MNDIKKITMLSMLSALAIVFGIIDNLIPLFNGVIPGFKIGCANIVIIYTLYKLNSKDALIVSVLRVIILAIFTTGILDTRFIFSISGAIGSFLVMSLFKKINIFSTIGVSVIGSVTHGIIQILVSMVILNQKEMALYIPPIIIISIISGIVIGQLAKTLIDIKI